MLVGVDTVGVSSHRLGRALMFCSLSGPGPLSGDSLIPPKAAVDNVGSSFYLVSRGVLLDVPSFRGTPKWPSAFHLAFLFYPRKRLL